MLFGSVYGESFSPPYIAKNTNQYSWIYSEIENAEEKNRISRDRLISDNLSNLDFTFNTPLSDKKIHVGSWLDTNWSRNFNIYYLQMFKDEQLINDVIPVRKNNGEVAMYDFINGEYLSFYYPELIQRLF